MFCQVSNRRNVILDISCNFDIIRLIRLTIETGTDGYVFSVNIKLRSDVIEEGISGNLKTKLRPRIDPWMTAELAWNVQNERPFRITFMLLFLFRVTLLTSKLWAVLFLCITREFERLSNRKSLLCFESGVLNHVLFPRYEGRTGSERNREKNYK